MRVFVQPCKYVPGDTAMSRAVDAKRPAECAEGVAGTSGSTQHLDTDDWVGCGDSGVGGGVVECDGVALPANAPTEL